MQPVLQNSIFEFSLKSGSKWPEDRLLPFSFARAFQLHTVIYNLMFPHFLYPGTNVALAASIFFTVSLGLERYVETRARE